MYYYTTESLTSSKENIIDDIMPTLHAFAWKFTPGFKSQTCNLHILKNIKDWRLSHDQTFPEGRKIRFVSSQYDVGDLYNKCWDLMSSNPDWFDSTKLASNLEKYRIALSALAGGISNEYVGFSMLDPDEINEIIEHELSTIFDRIRQSITDASQAKNRWVNQKARTKRNIRRLWILWLDVPINVTKTSNKRRQVMFTTKPDSNFMVNLLVHQRNIEPMEELHGVAFMSQNSSIGFVMSNEKAYTELVEAVTYEKLRYVQE